ncbi:MAG: HIG1 domain-containing protein [Burkholderiales bacterium]|nr:HIG1 domain-containing protein [Burkholderiales bacterium]
MDLLTLAVLVAVAATIWSLFAGLSSMAVDGPVARHESTHWMIRRVAFQAAALALVLLATRA